MKRIIAALVIAVLPVSVAPVFAADKAAKSAASPAVQKELQKLKDAYGAGSLSAKEYQKRKEALLGGKK